MQPMPHRKHYPRAIVLMLLGLSLLLCLDACGKYLGARGVPVGASTWSRYAGHFLVVLLVFLPRDGVRLFRAQRPSIQWARGVCMVLVTLFYFSALAYLQLAEATAIFFLTPILTSIFSIWFLRERPSRWSIAAIALGFVGVLVVARPGAHVPILGILLVLGAALSNAAYQTLTRAASASASHPERSSTQVLYAGMVGALVMTLAAPLWWVPGWMEDKSVTTWMVFASTGLLGALGHLLLIRAYKLAPATVIAPWMYMQLALSVLIGWVVFGAVPDAVSLMGMAVIALAPQLTRLARTSRG
jgi:drug/metabolite transporter (DMT)-like permease